VVVGVLLKPRSLSYWVRREEGSDGSGAATEGTECGICFGGEALRGAITGAMGRRESVGKASHAIISFTDMGGALFVVNTRREDSPSCIPRRTTSNSALTSPFPGRTSFLWMVRPVAVVVSKRAQTKLSAGFNVPP